MIPVHVPVMALEVLEHLSLPPEGGLVIDGTLGEAGHASAFLAAFPKCKVLGIDTDKTMRDRAAQRLAPWAGRWEILAGWADEVLADWDKSAPSRILMDLGISIFHYEGSGRGFSFKAAEPLDMRLSTDEDVSAADLVNGLREEELADLIYLNGEERYSRRIARTLVARRREAPIETTDRLADLVRLAVPPQARHGRLHPATRTFQALRITVNHELDHLDRFLDIAPALLAPGGRLGIVSFHSLEDRRVKRHFSAADNSNISVFIITEERQS